jgi:hypothetical protein
VTRSDRQTLARKLEYLRKQLDLLEGNRAMAKPDFLLSWKNAWPMNDSLNSRSNQSSI